MVDYSCVCASQLNASSLFPGGYPPVLPPDHMLTPGVDFTGEANDQLWYCWNADSFDIEW